MSDKSLNKKKERENVKFFLARSHLAGGHLSGAVVEVSDGDVGGGSVHTEQKLGHQCHVGRRGVLSGTRKAVVFYK